MLWQCQYDESVVDEDNDDDDGGGEEGEAASESSHWGKHTSKGLETTIGIICVNVELTDIFILLLDTCDVYVFSFNSFSSTTLLMSRRSCLNLPRNTSAKS